MFKLRTSLLALAIVLLFEAVISENVTSPNGTNEFSENETSRVLSRRKRFLIFPDGSSLQLVFCVQTPALIPIGDIFLYSNTAALAWTLPSDPMFLTSLKEKEAQRRGDNKVIGYVDDKGRVIARVPYTRLVVVAPFGYRPPPGFSMCLCFLPLLTSCSSYYWNTRRPIINPAFAKRSVDQMSFKEKLKVRLDKMKIHQHQTQREYLREYLDSNSIEFHRSSRLELFKKLEVLIKALGQDGRQCVLYKLCEAAQRTEQGTFLQEFLRVVFTLPKGKEFEEQYHREYDEAHMATEDCSAKYPGCDLVTQ